MPRIKYSWVWVVSIWTLAHCVHPCSNRENPVLSILYIGHLSTVWKYIFLKHTCTCIFFAKSFTYKYLNNIGTGISPHIIQPPRQTYEWSSLSYIISHNHSISTAVVTLCDSAEPFLASCIPDLQLKKWDMSKSEKANRSNITRDIMLNEC